MSSDHGAHRHHALKAMLEERRQAVFASIRQDLREGSEHGAARSSDVLDSCDSVRATSDDDLRFALLPMKTALLKHIEDALERLAEGRYGRCRACQRRIPERRLAAMPFAVRCRICEERREQSRLVKRVDTRPAYVS